MGKGAALKLVLPEPNLSAAAAASGSRSQGCNACFSDDEFARGTFCQPCLLCPLLSPLLSPQRSCSQFFVLSLLPLHTHTHAMESRLISNTQELAYGTVVDAYFMMLVSSSACGSDFTVPTSKSKLSQLLQTSQPRCTPYAGQSDCS